MLSKPASRRAALLGLLGLAACGFTPVYGPGGVGAAWQNAVAIEAPDTVLGFRMAGRLGEQFGPATNARYTLGVTPQAAPVSATITEDGDITRFNLTGNAMWVLRDATGASVADGLVQTFTSYSATGTTVATQAAEADAERRLAIALADLVVAQLLTRGIAQ